MRNLSKKSASFFLSLVMVFALFSFIIPLPASAKSAQEGYRDVVVTLKNGDMYSDIFSVCAFKIIAETNEGTVTVFDGVAEKQAIHLFGKRRVSMSIPEGSSLRFESYERRDGYRYENEAQASKAVSINNIKMQKDGKSDITAKHIKYAAGGRDNYKLLLDYEQA